MNWIKKYKFKTKKISISSNNWNSFGKMDYLLGRNLSEFDFKEEITEQEFFGGFSLILKDFIHDIWIIDFSMVEKDLKQIRKIKLNNLINVPNPI